MSCSDATPKEKQTRFSLVGTTTTCKNLKFDNNRYTLTECTNNVKEIINATNIEVYE